MMMAVEEVVEGKRDGTGRNCRSPNPDLMWRCMRPREIRLTV
jgi:hypothetical protein